MLLLVLGMVLFAGVHLTPSLAPSVKAGAMQRLGEGPYKGIFSLLLLAALALIIVGWRDVEPVPVYPPPESLHVFALGLLGVAFLLMAASARNSRLRLLIRHPQLTGVALWGIAHLMLNGDNRSLVLFGGMALWAAVEIVAINRREGVWIKGSPPSWGAELVTLCIAAITVAVVVVVHPWISGLPVW